MTSPNCPIQFACTVRTITPFTCVDGMWRIVHTVSTVLNINVSGFIGPCFSCICLQNTIQNPYGFPSPRVSTSVFLPRQSSHGRPSDLCCALQSPAGFMSWVSHWSATAYGPVQSAYSRMDAYNIPGCNIASVCHWPLVITKPKGFYLPNPATLSGKLARDLKVCWLPFTLFFFVLARKHILICDCQET